MGSLRTISPAPGVWGYSNTAEGIIVMCTAAVALEHGDVVVMDTTAGNVTSVTTTTTVDLIRVFGVVQDPTLIGALGTTAYAAGEAVPVMICGAGKVNVGAAAPAAGGILSTSATAGAAAVSGTATFGTAIAVVVHATKDSNNCVPALIGRF